MIEIRENVKSQFYQRNWVVDSIDPYNMALDIISYMHAFGSLQVKHNVVSTNGPRHTAEIHFFVERKFDRYSKLFFLVKMKADITMKKLAINALGLSQMQTPVGGHAGEVFHEWYMKEIYPEIHKKSTKITNEIITAFEKHVQKLVEEEQN